MEQTRGRGGARASPRVSSPAGEGAPVLLRRKLLAAASEGLEVRGRVATAGRSKDTPSFQWFIHSFTRPFVPGAFIRQWHQEPP